MKIAIDARFLGPEGAGLGKYSEKLLDNLQKIDKKNQYFILLRKNNFDLFSLKNKNFKKILADARWYSIKEQILITRILNRLRPDITHFLHYNVPIFWNRRFVVTIYDITKLEYGKQASNISNPLVFYPKQIFHNFVLNRAVQKSVEIVAGSKSTKRKITTKLGINKSKINVIYAGVDEGFSEKNEGVNKNTKEILKKYKVKIPYILYVGNAFPYKNVELILETVKRLNGKINFVYVSSRGDFTEKLKTKAKVLGIGEKVVATGYVPDKDLSTLYGLAKCFVFPSLSEGFGLPGLEAMAAGCPVLSSNIEVLREIYGDAAEYFNPKDVETLVNKVELVLRSEKTKKELVSKGRGQVEKYSWEKTARETLAVYNEVLELNRLK